MPRIGARPSTRRRRRRRPPSAPAAKSGPKAATPRTFPSSTASATPSSNTYTLNFSYGVGLVADGTGVLLNNELDDFAAKADAPNAYGLLGDKANAPGPGKRPLSSMTPTIVLKDGKPYLVTGTPGGSRIITAVLQVVTDVIDRGMDVASAVSKPRLHNQWMPDQVLAEPGFRPTCSPRWKRAATTSSCKNSRRRRIRSW